jgi:hypothetical protein
VPGDQWQHVADQREALDANIRAAPQGAASTSACAMSYFRQTVSCLQADRGCHSVPLQSKGAIRRSHLPLWSLL